MDMDTVTDPQLSIPRELTEQEIDDILIKEQETIDSLIDELLLVPPPALLLVKELCHGKTITCLEKDSKKYALVETIHIVFFSSFQLWQVAFAVETMCNMSLLRLTHEEELAFIEAYRIPATHLRLPKALQLCDFQVNFDLVVSALMIMFRHGGDSAVDLSLLDSLLGEQPTLGTLDARSVSRDHSQTTAIFNQASASSYHDNNQSEQYETKRRSNRGKIVTAPGVMNSSQVKRSPRDVLSKAVVQPPAPAAECLVMNNRNIPFIQRTNNKVVTSLELLRHHFFNLCSSNVFLKKVVELDIEVFSLTRTEMWSFINHYPTAGPRMLRSLGVYIQEFRMKSFPRLKELLAGEQTKRGLPLAVTFTRDYSRTRHRNASSTSLGPARLAPTRVNRSAEALHAVRKNSLRSVDKLHLCNTHREHM